MRSRKRYFHGSPVLNINLPRLIIATITRPLMYISAIMRHQAERLESIVGDSIPGLGDLKNLELKLMFLLNTIDKDVLSGTTITASSHQLFKLATDLIDVYWNVVNQGLALVRRWHEDDLEAWLRLAD